MQSTPADLPEGYAQPPVMECVGCLHSTQFGIRNEAHCQHPEAPRHVVYGGVLKCIELRTNPTLCGMDGAWFEPRPEPAEPQRVEPEQAHLSLWTQYGRPVLDTIAQPLALMLLGVALYAGIAWVSGAIREKRDEIRERRSRSTEQHPEQLSRETPQLVPPGFLAEVVGPRSESAYAIRRDDQCLHVHEGAHVSAAVGDQFTLPELLKQPPVFSGLDVYGFDFTAADLSQQLDIARERGTGRIVIPFRFAHALCAPRLLVTEA